jgi:hypothetical protein
LANHELSTPPRGRRTAAESKAEQRWPAYPNNSRLARRGSPFDLTFSSIRSPAGSTPLCLLHPRRATGNFCPIAFVSLRQSLRGNGEETRTWRLARMAEGCPAMAKEPRIPSRNVFRSARSTIATPIARRRRSLRSGVA